MKSSPQTNYYFIIQTSQREVTTEMSKTHYTNHACKIFFMCDIAEYLI